MISRLFFIFILFLMFRSYWTLSIYFPVINSFGTKIKNI